MLACHSFLREAHHLHIELEYRGLDKEPDDCLKDTIESCICIMGRGGIRPRDYANFKAGISSIQGHIFAGKILPAMPKTVPKRLTRFQPESPRSFPRMRSASRQMSSFPYTESCLPVSILMQDVFGTTILRKRNGCLTGRQ